MLNIALGFSLFPFCKCELHKKFHSPVFKNLYYYSKVTDGSKNKIYPAKELREAIILFRTEDKKSTGFITNASF